MSADLEELLNRQYAVMRQLDPRAITPSDSIKASYVRDMTLSAIVELTEALNEWGWKPWSTRVGVDREKFVGELADVMCFYMNLMLVGGVSAAELCDAVAAKQKVNLERNRDGYAG